MYRISIINFNQMNLLLKLEGVRLSAKNLLMNFMHAQVSKRQFEIFKIQEIKEKISCYRYITSDCCINHEDKPGISLLFERITVMIYHCMKAIPVFSLQRNTVQIVLEYLHAPFNLAQCLDPGLRHWLTADIISLYCFLADVHYTL